MTSIHERLLRRRSVLVEWSANGVPAGKSPPTGLKGLMSWADPDLGIQPIGHRNACTTTHPENGPLVTDCTRLMGELAKRRPRARPGTEATNKSLRERLRERDDRLVGLASQWTAAKAETETLRKQLTSVEEQLTQALNELAQHKRDAMKVVSLR